MGLRRIHVNAPVIISVAAISLLVLAIDTIVGGGLNIQLAAWFTSWSDPRMYLRMFTHVLAHQDLAHYTGNFLLILAVGPMVEEKYGSGRLAFMFLATAFVTGLVNVTFFRNTAVIGASGLVFMLILLASFTNIQEDRLPLTVLLVGILYLGNEVIAWIAVSDNIARLSHILGGFCGAGFGLAFHWNVLGNGKKTDRPKEN